MDEAEYPIKDEVDYLIAQVQMETKIAQEIVDDILLRQNSSGQSKGRNDGSSYYEEKLALKVLEFFKQEEKVISLYAEAKKMYPLLAELMENKRPYLKEMLAEAKKLYEKLCK